MAKFVILINYTGDEQAQIRALPERLVLAGQAAEQLGITIESYHLTLGRYDAIAIIDAPDEAAAAKFILSTIGSGRVRTETMTAFSDEQLQAIADGLLS